MEQGPSTNKRFSTENLDYLQRTGDSFFLPDDMGEIDIGAPPNKTVCHIRSVGRLAKDPPSDARQTAVQDWQLSHLVSEALLIGLHQQGHPVAFRLQGNGAGTHLSLGLWSNSPERSVPSNAAGILQALLDGAYPGIELDDVGTPEAATTVSDFRGGLVRGVPTPKPPDATDGAYAVDRLIRAMTGETWEAIVLAEPMPEASIRRLRGFLLAEMRAMYSTAQTSSPTPLAEHYNDLLEANLDAFTTGQAVGAWRVGVYLVGTESSYARLSGTWRGIFSGESSKPEPVRVTPLNGVMDLAANWLLPDDHEQPGPGGYSHPYRYQTVLNSSQLAGYVHLPQLETAGFSVKIAPHFDTVPATIDRAEQFPIGDRIVSRSRDARSSDTNGVDSSQANLTPSRYAIKRGSLSKHVLVCGITGSGKTNTIFQLLREAARAQIPFLVLEPAKAEYRSLLEDDIIGPSLQVFTVGAEWASPLRLNPFEILPGVPVGLHVDLLRSVFGASFGMWVPLPQILERSLNEVYEDRGWDLAGRRPIEGDDFPPFPTLGDIAEKVREIVPGLGFDPEARDRILGNLAARFEGLQYGAKGRMYDMERSIEMDTLLSQPTILEMESLGDDDDKAFLMGLLFIRLVEHRRVRHQTGRGNDQHLLVIEEAHRLLTNVPRNMDAEQADPRGKAVETFTNLLSEIRAYDEGVIIADQVPTRLAPDVIKNTNLKIAHRIVAGDDREAMGRAMSMNKRHIEALSSLEDLHAAVFSGESDDAPLLVSFDYIKQHTQPSDAQIRNAMGATETWRFFRTPACVNTCQIANRRDGDAPVPTDIECGIAKRALADAACRESLTRLVVSAIDNQETVDRLGSNLYGAVLHTVASGANPDRVYACYAVHGADWVADHWGAQRRWSRSQIARFAGAVRTMLRSLPPTGEGDLNTAVAEFQSVARDLHVREWSPYELCDQICEQRPGLCLYRHPGAELLRSLEFRDKLNALRAQGYVPIGDLEDLTRRIAWRLVPLPGSELPQGLDERSTRDVQGTFRRTQLCLAQQAIVGNPSILPTKARELLQGMQAEMDKVDYTYGDAGEALE